MIWVAFTGECEDYISEDTQQLVMRSYGNEDDSLA